MELRVIIEERHDSTLTFGAEGGSASSSYRRRMPQCGRRSRRRLTGIY
jgi:hypothetical protein